MQASEVPGSGRTREKDRRPRISESAVQSLELPGLGWIHKNGSWLQLRLSRFRTGQHQPRPDSPFPPAGRGGRLAVLCSLDATLRSSIAAAFRVPSSIGSSPEHPPLYPHSFPLCHSPLRSKSLRALGCWPASASQAPCRTRQPSPLARSVCEPSPLPHRRHAAAGRASC